jgi:hypothetical protein
VAVPFQKTSFAGGEIAPELWGHADLARVETSATTMRNCFVDYRGGAKSRAGTSFILASKQRPDLGNSPPRLINWQFNVQQGYVLEFGDNYVRFYFEGSVVVENGIAVTAISQATPGVISTAPTAHGYNTGDWVIPQNIGGMVNLDDNAYIITVLTTTTFSIADSINNLPVNTALFPAFTGGGTVSRIYTVASPYAASDLAYLKYTQSADVMSLCCVNPNGGSYAPYDLARLGPLDWTLTATAFGTTSPEVTGISVTATTQPNSSTSPPTLPAAYAYEVTSVNAATGEESQSAGPVNVTNGVDMAETAGSNIVNWNAVAGNGYYYNIYRAPTSYNTDPGSTTVALPVPVGANFYLVGAAYGTQFVDSNITQDFDQVPPQHFDPFAPGQVLGIPISASSADWTAAAVSITTSTGSGFVGQVVISPTPTGSVVAVIVVNPGINYRSTDTPVFAGTGTSASGTVNVGQLTGTYPGVVSYFQERRVYSQTLNAPDTFFMSQPGLFTDFDASIPVIDSDAITGTVTAETVDGIQWMLSMPLGLLSFTGAGVWQIGAPGSFASSPAAVTPTNIIAFPQSSIGCSPTVPPLRINWDVLYAEIANNTVLDLAYQIFFNIYAGTDISWPSTHLLQNYQILQWSYARQPYRLVWAVRNDGVLLSLSYVKEQELAGWARHDTQGQFRSVTSVIESPISSVEVPPVNAVYFATERPVSAGGTRFFIERMNNRLWQTIEDSWCVDAAVSAGPLEFPSDYNATLYASSAVGNVTFTATASVFSAIGAGYVGQTLRMGGGIAIITAYLGPTQLAGTWNLPCQETYPTDPNNAPLPQPSGSWNIEANNTVFGGLGHLIGRQVVGTADGVPVGPFVVNALGQVTLPFAASNVVIGLAFTPQIQSVYLNGGQPTIQGRRKLIYNVTVRVQGSLLPQVGTNQTDASTIPPVIAVPWTNGMVTPQLAFVDPTPPATYTSPGGATVQPVFTGDVYVKVPAKPRKPGQVAVQQTLPVPLNVLSFIPDLQTGDQPEDALPPRQQQQGRAA